MNARLTLTDAVALPATAEPSNDEQARRLELFEISLRDERIEELELDIGCGQAREEALRDKVAPLRQKVCRLQLDCQRLTDYNAELEAAGDQLANDKERLQAEIERITVQAFARDRVTEKALAAQRDAEAELKRLRQLDPERLGRKVKRLQKEKTELQTAGEQLRATNKRLTLSNRELATQNRKLDAALDKACADINAAQVLEPIRVIEPARLGRWELYSCEHEGVYQVLDVENHVSRTVHIDGGELVQPKLRALPKAIGAWVVEVHNEYFGGKNNG